MKYGLKLNKDNIILEVYLDINQEFPNYNELGFTIYDIEGDTQPQSYIYKLIQIDDKYYLEENTDYPEEYYTEQAQDAALLEIESLKCYLLDTDFVVIKIQEALINESTESAATLKEKYADILTARQSARKRINELEA